MNVLREVTPGKHIPEEINVIIEIPKGSKNKYEIDKETGLVALDRVLHTAQDYPFDYGFVPQTHWHDGDPLDVVVLTTYPLHPGILVSVRPVAVARMIDSGEHDEKIIAVPIKDPRFKDVKDLGDINKHTIKELEHFFLTYKQLQDKVVEIRGVDGADMAKKVILEAVELYKKEKHA